MKKICMGIIALLVSMTLFAERITQEDAALVANHFMNPAANTSIKKVRPTKRMVRKATAETNRYYIYENADGEGWVIISADDAVTPVLAFSETGHFNTEKMPVNLSKWMSKYDHFIQKLENDGVTASAETKAEWAALRASARKSTAAVVVGPLVETKWDQDSPYYNLCPGTGTNKAYTGCVATAMAQVMKYWEWPVKGTGSHSYKPLDPNSGESYSSRYTSTLSANFGETVYDWANMKNSYTGSYTTAQATAVATLMYHCGVATEMMYGNDDDGGSGTYTDNYGDWEDHACAQNALWMNFGYKKDSITSYVRDGFTYYGVTYYEKWTDADWTAMIKKELDKNRPIMYGGASSQGGHSFICDGYRSDDYFHFNWGWSGSNDGYFKLSKLAPGSGGAGGGDYDFSEDQDVIIGIIPDKKDLPKVTVTWSVKGEETTTEFTQEDALILPDAPANCSESRVFVGWTTNNTVTGEQPADLFTTATGKTVTEAVTYYAVFADRSSDGGSAAFDGKTSGAFKIYATVDNTNYYATTVSNNKLQSTTDESAATTFTFTAVDGGFTIADGSKYIKHGSGTNISSSATAFTWKIDKGTRGSWRLASQEEGRALLFRAGTYNLFGGYSTKNIKDDGEYYDVEIGGGSAVSYKNYSLLCDSNEGTDIEHTLASPKATKVLENGQVIILRGNERYTVFGQKIQ